MTEARDGAGAGSSPRNEAISGLQGGAGQPGGHHSGRGHGAGAAAGRGGGSSAGGGAAASGDKRSEIYTHEFDCMVYACSWSVRDESRFRLAIGSFREDTYNWVQIVHLDDALGGFMAPPRLRFRHPYPPTKIAFLPDKDESKPDLLATSGDHLRIWRVTEDGVTLDRLLTTATASCDSVAPLTSFDWNEGDSHRLGTCSVDTTVTVWDIEKGQAEVQLVAHEREVYDIAWGGPSIFSTVSADGSVRIFDLRDQQHSTIIYESPQPDTPLLRIAWNRLDPRYMATLPMDSSKVVVLDIRYPTVPVAELCRHQGYANAIAWAPHSASHICTAGDDCQALIWDIEPVAAAQQAAQQADGSAIAPTTQRSLDPILAYTAEAEVNQLQWSTGHPDWVAICFGQKVQILRV